MNTNFFVFSIFLRGYTVPGVGGLFAITGRMTGAGLRADRNDLYICLVMEKATKYKYFLLEKSGGMDTRWSERDVS